MGEASPARYFPLRWESTGDQWWYASPIDWAAANGHYDLVVELLRIDGNHLIKLTSLRRIRRLETVWDDHRSFHGAAKCRAAVARRLYLRCRSSLIRSGYGGWLLYTAASAGDLGFARDLLRRNPLLVFGEGEYGLTDLLYAAARGRCPDLFRLLLDSAAGDDSAAGVYAWEITNRAVHAAARGGDLTVLKELLAGCSDVLAYRDVHGSTVLHTAAARGQLQILKYLTETYDVITASTDNHGNTALHVAAFRGQLAAAEAMMTASPQLIYLRNHAGETFLHRAVSGFHTLQFRPLDRHLALLRRLVSVNAVVNARDSEGRTALHAAVSGGGSVHPDLVRILMSADSADLNAADSDGLTALDILRRRPRTASSDVLIRQLISAGASDHGGAAVVRRAVASRLKMQGNSSPGSSFRISDSEILLYAGSVEPNSSAGAASPELSPCSRDEDRRRSSFASAAAKPISSVGIFKQVLNWPRALSNKKLPNNKSVNYDYGDDDGVVPTEAAEPPTPLRKRFSKPSSPAEAGLQSNKRTLAARSNQSSPNHSANKKTKKKKLTVVPPGKRSSRSSSFSSSSENNVKQKGLAESDIAGPSSSSSTNSNSKRTMKSQYYLCFGNAGVSEVKSPGNNRQSFKRTVSLLA